MTVMILLGSAEHASAVAEYIAKCSSGCVVVVSKDVAGVLGKKLYERIGPACEKIMVVFGARNPEDHALRIVAENPPDKVIDCDPESKLSFVKKLLEKMIVERTACTEIAETP